ncbi:protein NDRG3-like isoform X1 [Centruroides sculpturatus]|uniref:protein NDRG3-like isoform X1 n=1 Tax=Centruroides sculpturatus TaxID=218467 RepID=UPI000C6D63CF|nr:protein NDRG3-like isoform X1 [Centruroides sculpturatus]XP_023233368.1 protein NDRG3-like isoform X1 [Centruroides sculpturatus]
MDDIELKNIESRQPLMRSLSRSDSYTQEDKVDTPFGTMTVAVQGERNRPAIVTYHDIGLNHVSNFQAFFNFMDTRILMQSFCVYHVNAPGQEEDAPPLPDGYTFPDMEQLAEMLLSVMKFYGLKHFVGFGVGAGANILCRFALAHPECVDGLFLINCCCTPSGWTEWGYQKLNSMYLRSSGMTASTQDYLMWHHFGKVTEERNHDLIQVYRQYFNKSINAKNLAMFIDTFVKRGDLGIIREMDFSKKKTAKNFSCHILLLAGALSPHLEDTVTMNSRLDPSNSTWMKLSDCGMVLEEQPGKVSEAFRLFLQGLGYALNQFRRKSSSASSCGEVPSLTTRKLTQSRQNSLEEEDTTTNGNKQEVHIVENPINQHSVTC